MSELPPPGAPAGWYADAEEGAAEGSERWWDGSRWSDRTRAGSSSPSPAPSPALARGPAPLVVRGTTGYVELADGVLLYRPKIDRPPLQRIALDTVQQVVVSRGGDTFDIILAGSRPRSRPSLFSETTIRRSSRTTPDDWDAFLIALGEAVARARQ